MKWVKTILKKNYINRIGYTKFVKIRVDMVKTALMWQEGLNMHKSERFKDDL